jgi:hypothetical protein
MNTPKIQALGITQEGAMTCWKATGDVEGVGWLRAWGTTLVAAMEAVQALATSAGGDISAWLRYAVQQITAADFPASWQATSAEQQRAPKRSHDSRQYGTRFMLRLDEVSLDKLDAFTQVFVTPRADVIRQLIMQATPKVFPKSWHLAAEERRQRQAGHADTRPRRA